MALKPDPRNYNWDLARKASAWNTRQLNERIRERGGGELRPCGCRVGASPGLRADYCGDLGLCDCCEFVEDLVRFVTGTERHLDGSRPKQKTVSVCMDCLRDWKIKV